jgi:hypothetical protein
MDRYIFGMDFPNPHAAIDAANYESDKRIAALIRRRPEVIEIARENLCNWHSRWGELAPAHREWEKILRMLTPAQLADFLESSTPKANRLRQSSPFCGITESSIVGEGSRRDAA